MKNTEVSTWVAQATQHHEAVYAETRRIGEFLLELCRAFEAMGLLEKEFTLPNDTNETRYFIRNGPEHVQDWPQYWVYANREVIGIIYTPHPIARGEDQSTDATRKIMWFLPDFVSGVVAFLESQDAAQMEERTIRVIEHLEIGTEQTLNPWFFAERDKLVAALRLGEFERLTVMALEWLCHPGRDANGEVEMNSVTRDYLFEVLRLKELLEANKQPTGTSVTPDTQLGASGDASD